MTFLNPIFLWFIPVVCIPFIIHLLHFRKPESLAFSSIAFIEELQKTVVRKLRLKEWILLVVRTLLTIGALLVLAQPVFNSELGASTGDSVPTVLVIDNSLGSNRVDENGPVLDQIKSIAIEMVNQNKDDKPWLIMPTTGNPQKGQVVTKKEAIKRIQRIESQTQVLNFAGLLPLLSEMETGKWIVLGDNHLKKWQLISAQFPNEIGQSLDFILVGNSSDANVFVRSIVLENQVVAINKPLQLRVDIGASGSDRSVNQVVRLKIDDQVQGEYQINVDPNTTQSLSFDVNPAKNGFLKGVIELEGDAFVADNKREFVLSVPELRQIAVITEEIETDEDLVYMRAMLLAANASRSDLAFTFFSVDELQTLQNSDFAGYFFLGLKEIPEFLYSMSADWVANERGLLIVPSVQSSIRSYNLFFNQLGLSVRYTGVLGSFSAPKVMASITINDISHPIFNSIFDVKTNEKLRFESPNVFAHLGVSNQASRFSLSILQTETNAPLVIEERISRAKVIISAIGPGGAWSNFASNPFFAPFWYKTAWYITVPVSGGIFQHELGTNLEVPMQGSSDDAQFIRADAQAEKPSLLKRGNRTVAQLTTWELSPSVVSLNQKEKLVFSTGLFLPDAYSDFSSASISDWKTFLDQYVKDVRVYDVNSQNRQQILEQSTQQGSILWPFLALFTLILLATESCISIWFRT